MLKSNSQTRYDRFTVWLVRRRFLVYALGLLFWWWFSFYLPGSTGGLPIPPLSIGYLLLFLNMISVLPGQELSNIPPYQTEQRDLEAKRIGLVQTYGGQVILAAAVITAIIGPTRITHTLLSYLGASITLGILSLVPIWTSQYDWRLLNLLRHIKTVLLIWAATWLAQAVVIILYST